MSYTAPRPLSAVVSLFATLLCTLSLQAQEHFFLPDEADDALWHLQRHIAEAKRSIVVITPHLSNSELLRALAKAVETGKTLTLVTSKSDTENAAALVRFRHVDYRTLTGQLSDAYEGRLAQTLVILDDAYGCSSALPLATDAFEHDVGLMECGSEPESIAAYRKASARIIERASPYLQP